ncbi:MAG: GGDEF domain-containing protein [Desulfuromonadaceae bacterium]|nr:GGDEF domain-containing protein [Desulfuromonadaceae bacterium]
MKLVDSLAKLPNSLIMALSLVLCAAVGVVDGIAGHAYLLVPFYLVPVILAAWCVGRKAGYLLSFTCSLGWLGSEIAAGVFIDADFAMYWNDAMKLLLFILTTTVISALREALGRENLLARTDHLTGMPNRRSYYEAVSGEIRRNLRYNDPFTIAYLDIDNFKDINDTRGHAEGDKLLKLVSSVLSKSVREIDMVARLGGDEFALLLPQTDGEAADIVANKVQQRLKVRVENSWPVTFSIGLVTYQKSPATIDEVIGRADRLMFVAKEAGKNALHREVVGNNYHSIPGHDIFG